MGTWHDVGLISCACCCTFNRKAVSLLIWYMSLYVSIYVCVYVYVCAGAGYDVSWHIIDARHFLPQARERVYLIGFRSDLGLSGGIPWTIGTDTGEDGQVRGD